MELSRQEYCSGLPFSFPGDLPNPRIKPQSPALQADFHLPTVGPTLLIQAYFIMKCLNSSCTWWLLYWKWKVKVLVSQSGPTLCNPMDFSPPGSSVQVTSQAKILEWVAISFSRWSSKLRDQTCISYIAGGFFTTEPPGKSTTFEYFLWKENWLIHLSRWVNTWLGLLPAPWKQCNFLQRIYIWNGL